MLTRLAVTFSLALALCLALAASVSLPGGIDAAREIGAAGDPLQLSELQLDRHFNAAVAAREIEQALQSGDLDLARSFIELAAEREVPVAPALKEKVESAEREAAKASSKVASFARGFVTGTPEDVAGCKASYTGRYLRPHLNT